MLRGAHSIALDGKGRMAIPTRYRNVLNEECHGCFVCTVDIHSPCLLLFPLDRWEVLEKKLSKLSSVNPAERKLQRVLLGNAIDCESDSNGRILIPQVLRDYAALEKNLMLVGQLNRFEIWSESKWKLELASDIETLQGENWTDSDGLRDFSLNDNG